MMGYIIRSERGRILWTELPTFQASRHSFLGGLVTRPSEAGLSEWPARWASGHGEGASAFGSLIQSLPLPFQSISEVLPMSPNTCRVDSGSQQRPSSGAAVERKLSAC